VLIWYWSCDKSQSVKNSKRALVGSIAGRDGADALAADEFSNFDLDGDGSTSDTLSDIAGFNPFDDTAEIN